MDAGPAARFSHMQKGGLAVKRALLGIVTLGLAVGLAVLAGVLLGSSAPEVSAQPAEPHYKCYEITGSAPDVPAVTLETQFGLERNVKVSQPSLLCLPAGKNGQPIPDVPHLKCYDFVGNLPGKKVTLQTQFVATPVPNVVVGHAHRLCIPVTKQVLPGPGTATPTPAGPPALSEAHYECFRITGNSPAQTVSLETQFDSGTPQAGISVGVPWELCAPALKDDNGDPSAPHLECYSITGDPPGATVNLNGQFGLENDVVVGPARLLCAPAIKGAPTPVGGVAQLPALDGSDANLAEDSGGISTGTYAAMAGVAAGAALVLSAGVLYARRRWLK